MTTPPPHVPTPPPHVPTPAWAVAVRHVAARSAGPPMDPDLRVTLNFHPDRGGRHTVLEALARDGVYRSQFETGTSNGGLTAHPGGDRWTWESRIFGAAYDHAPAAARPKYGALDLRRDPAGAARRFGSAHLRLTADTHPRTTFCHPDSAFTPTDFGVPTRMSLIAKAQSPPDDPLDDYVEAHVHGPIALAAHVEALVLDPCFRGTAIEAQARSLPCPLEWHHGFRLAPDAVDPAYRGPEIAALAHHMAPDGHVDARLIGEAAATGAHDPRSLKRLWHCVARFGDPAE